jgi:hypothetical protein
MIPDLALGAATPSSLSERVHHLKFIQVSSLRPANKCVCVCVLPVDLVLCLARILKALH